MKQPLPDSPTQRSDNEKIEIRIARSPSEAEALREVWTAWGGKRDSDIDFVLMIIESYPEALRSIRFLIPMHFPKRATNSSGN